VINLSTKSELIENSIDATDHIQHILLRLQNDIEHIEETVDELHTPSKNREYAKSKVFDIIAECVTIKKCLDELDFR
jgi:hypothetical protein